MYEFLQLPTDNMSFVLQYFQPATLNKTIPLTDQVESPKNTAISANILFEQSMTFTYMWSNQRNNHKTHFVTNFYKHQDCQN